MSPTPPFLQLAQTFSHDARPQARARGRRARDRECAARRDRLCSTAADEDRRVRSPVLQAPRHRAAPDSTAWRKSASGKQVSSPSASRKHLGQARRGRRRRARRPAWSTTTQQRQRVQGRGGPPADRGRVISKMS
jgi:hypothetical protein